MLANFQKWITIEKVNYFKKLEETDTKKSKIVKKSVKKIQLDELKTEQEILKFKAKNAEKPSKRDLRILKKKQQIKDKQQKERLAKIEKDVLIDVRKVRRTKQEQARAEAKQKANYIFKVGDKVRLEDARSIGTIEKIEKKWVFVNFGIFISKTTIDKLEFVER